MMNWSDYLNSLKLLIVHTTKIFALAFLLIVSVSAQQNSAPEDSTSSLNDSTFVMQKSPWGAVLRSAIIPGWGQIYNHSYIKAPIIWGISAWLIYGWVHYNNLYIDYRDRYLLYNSTRDLSNRNFYKDQRDLFAIYMGLAYFLNLVDAYVDAQLFDFNISENQRINVPMLNIKVNF